MLAAVVENQKTSGFKLQLREMPSGLCDKPLELAPPESPKALLKCRKMAFGCRIRQRMAMTQSRIARSYGFAASALNQKLVWKPAKDFNALSINSSSHRQQGLCLASGLSRFQEGSKSLFKVSAINEDGTHIGPSTITVPISNNVESWSATILGDQILLAYRRRFSAWGVNAQSCQLELGDLGAVVNWVKTRTLLNEHVSEPIWITQGEVAQLVVPKWVDGESTLATYRVGRFDIESSAVSGLFPKGMRVLNGFSPASSNTPLVLLRHKSNPGWRFELCRLKDL